MTHSVMFFRIGKPKISFTYGQPFAVEDVELVAYDRLVIVAILALRTILAGTRLPAVNAVSAHVSTLSQGIRPSSCSPPPGSQNRPPPLFPSPSLVLHPFSF